MIGVYDVIKKPLVTEKGVTKKDADRTLCFEVAAKANKTQIRQAVEAVFKVKVEDVRTSVTAGKLRRQGRFAGYRPDWKKAWVRLKAGEKMPEYAEI
jgi:large subunit ribosomal protein L23